MPKKLDQTNLNCPQCNAQMLKNGTRKIKQRAYQRFFCKSCKKSFTTQPSLQKSKTYSLKTILESISNYNLGHSLRAITKTNQIPKSTIHNWINQLKKDLPFNRLRKNIKLNPIIKQQFIHHKQPFLYQYHNLKLQFAQKFPSLIQYLQQLPTSLPSFDNTRRISEAAREISTTLARARRGLAPSECRVDRRSSEANDVVEISNIKYNLIPKQNYATTLANIALQITTNNKERHSIIENFMLINDTATIAVEIPVYLKDQNLTGHIDILQIKFHKIYLLDYKPEPINESQAINQLILYRKALSQLTNIPEYKFNLAFFNEKGYYEINS